MLKKKGEGLDVAGVVHQSMMMIMICREDELGMEAEVGFGNIGFLLSGPSHSLMMATQEGEVQIRCLTRKDVGQVTMGAHPPNSQPYPRNSCSSCSRGRGR